MRPSVASAFGRLMSIGSSATNTRPSGAQATTEGCLIFGASAMSSMRQPAIGCGKTEPPKAAEPQKRTKETKSELTSIAPFIPKCMKLPALPEDSQSSTVPGMVRVAVLRGNPVPLTLTLSHGEREQLAAGSIVREVRRADTGLCPAEREPRILPLLRGEGRGEGKGEVLCANRVGAAP